MITEFMTDQPGETINTQDPTLLADQIQVQSQPEKILTVMQRATSLVDRVTDSLYRQIIEGLQRMNRKKPIPTSQQHSQDAKKKLNTSQIHLDIDQHKRMIRRFMHMSKKLRKARQQRSMEFIQSYRKIQEQEERKKIQERNKTIEMRKCQIQDRLKEKQQMKKQIKRSLIESNRKFNTINKSKFLYQQKEQKFKRQYILPKIQQQRRILQKKRQEMRPIDMTLLLQHQKKYQQKIINDRINRSLTSRVVKIQNHYEPPKYVPKSFLISEAQQQLKKQQQKLKIQEVQVNQYRKKQFLKVLEERKKNQLQKLKEANLENRSIKSISLADNNTAKEKVKVELNRQQTKNKGNQYMKQLIMLNRIKRKKAASESNTDKAISIQDKPKSAFEVQLIKQQNIQRFHKIRVRKIDQILHNQHIDSRFKLQRLDYQNQKLNELVKGNKDKLGLNENGETVSLYLSSIHTKLAILQVISPKKQE